MRYTLFAAGMMTAFSAAALASPALAAPPSGATQSSLQQQIDALQSQIDQLSRQQATQSPAPASSTVQPAVASWVNDTKFGAKMYFDATNLSQNLNGSKGTANGLGFDVKRFYLSMDHAFDSTWSMNLTTDFHYSSADGKSTIFVKKAYVQGAFSPLFKLRAGSSDLPWVPYEENLYGFRYVEPTVEDRMGLISSADWGVHAAGERGIFDYQLSVVSGGSYNHVNFRTRQPDVALRLGLHPFDGLTVAAGGYAGKHGQAVGGGPATRDGLLYHVLVGYVNDGLRLGGEYFNQMNPQTYKDGSFGGTSFPFLKNKALLRSSPNQSDRADGYSLWASYEIMKPITAFARFDKVRPSRNVDPSLTDTYFNVGAQYEIRKGIVASLVYKHDRVRNSKDSLINNEIGLFSEIKF
ncbi:MAG: hypothetical protein EPN72_04110 [Nevskiaceae bacterium]|nr:MAG: hypothetical protein EPN63_06890 [Nevskiaceae bacterium]TBR74000.1 MAG: hypothetical protein EPN72_04110 [Nevskiaceae bacterium]